MIGRLGYGELRLIGAGDVHRYYVDGGFVQVADNVVSILTNRAIPAEQLDPTLIAGRLEEAREMRANTPETLAARERAETQYRAQLRVARARPHAGAAARH